MAHDVSRLDWYTEFRGRLRVVRYFPEEEIDALVAEVAEYCADSGERPEEAFGTAAEYADGLVRERVPEVERARRGVDGITGTDVLLGAGIMVGFHLVVLTIVLLVGGEWVVNLTVAGLAGFAAVGLIAALWASGAAARRAGRPRLGALCWIVSAPLFPLAGALFTQLPRTSLGQVWSVLLGGAGLGLMALSLSRLGGVQRRRRTPAEPDDTERWFRRLHGLLVGRHEIGHGPARGIVAESRAYLRGSGASTPEEEFGPVERYALRVAEQAEHHPPWWRRQEILSPAMAVLWLSAFLLAVLDGETGWLMWAYLFVALCFAGAGVLALRRARRDSVRSHQVQ